MACQSTPSPEVTFAAGCIELFLPVAVPSQRPLGRSPGARQPPCGVRHRALSGGLWIPPAFRLPAFASCTFLRPRSEEHTSELQSRVDLVCRLLLEKKKKKL